MPTTGYVEYNARTAFTITLDNLADNAARQSNAIDFGALNIREALIDLVGQIAAGAGATGTIEIYGFGSWDGGTNYTDGAGANDAAFTVANIKTMPRIAVVTANVASQVLKTRGYSLSKGFDWTLPPIGGVVVWNRTGAAFPNPPGTAFSLGYTGIYDKSETV